MKKIIYFSLIQGLVIFVITGILAYLMRGSFFYSYLAPIFGLAAAVFRLFTSLIIKNLAPALYQDEKKE